MNDRDQVDRDLMKIMTAAGVVMLIMGALILWRGVTRMIPIMGLANGITYCIVGAVVAVGGVLFLVVPRRMYRKRHEKEDGEQDPGDAR